MKKSQFKIYVDPLLFDKVQKLDFIMNKNRKRDRHGNLKDNVNKSEYWEGVMKEHLNSVEVRDLLRISEGVKKGSWKFDE